MSSSEMNTNENGLPPKVRVATAWLDGCSGCHMSFLDLDERLIELAAKIDLVYSPVVDLKEYPENVDVALVEGAVSSADDLHKARIIRARTKIVVALGDCAVTSNVPAMRNPFGVEKIMARVYGSGGPGAPSPKAVIPTEVVPLLTKNSRPLHEIVKVDVFVPGCPPSADTIWAIITELLGGKAPAATDYTRFGA